MDNIIGFFNAIGQFLGDTISSLKEILSFVLGFFDFLWRIWDIFPPPFNGVLKIFITILISILLYRTLRR